MKLSEVEPHALGMTVCAFLQQEAADTLSEVLGVAGRSSLTAIVAACDGQHDVPPLAVIVRDLAIYAQCGKCPPMWTYPAADGPKAVRHVRKATRLLFCPPPHYASVPLELVLRATETRARLGNVGSEIGSAELSIISGLTQRAVQQDAARNRRKLPMSGFEAEEWLRAHGVKFAQDGAR